jgi:hypothetical protein
VEKSPPPHRWFALISPKPGAEDILCSGKKSVTASDHAMGLR